MSEIRELIERGLQLVRRNPQLEVSSPAGLAAVAGVDARDVRADHEPAMRVGDVDHPIGDVAKVLGRGGEGEIHFLVDLAAGRGGGGGGGRGHARVPPWSRASRARRARTYPPPLRCRRLHSDRRCPGSPAPARSPPLSPPRAAIRHLHRSFRSPGRPPRRPRPPASPPPPQGRSAAAAGWRGGGRRRRRAGETGTGSAPGRQPPRGNPAAAHSSSSRENSESTVWPFLAQQARQLGVVKQLHRTPLSAS